MAELKDAEDIFILGFNSLCVGHCEPNLSHLVKLQRQYILKCKPAQHAYIITFHITTPVVNYLWEEEAKHYSESNILGLLVGWGDTAHMVDCWHVQHQQQLPEKPCGLNGLLVSSMKWCSFHATHVAITWWNIKTSWTCALMQTD